MLIEIHNLDCPDVVRFDRALALRPPRSSSPHIAHDDGLTITCTAAVHNVYRWLQLPFDQALVDAERTV